MADGYASVAEQLHCARQEMPKDPLFAAGICWRLLQLANVDGDRPSLGYLGKKNPFHESAKINHRTITDEQVAEARRILREGKQPGQTPLATGAVFDIEALRKMKVKYALL